MFISDKSEFKDPNSTIEEYLQTVFFEDDFEKVEPIIWALCGISILSSALILMVTSCKDGLSHSEFKSIGYLALSYLILHVG